MSGTSRRAQIAHLKKNDPKLKRVIEGITLKELAAPRGYFEALVEAITSQQLSVKAADTIFARFCALTPGKKCPTPREVIKIPPAKLRACGLSGMKVKFIKDLAKHVANKTLDLETIDALSDADVIARLTAVKGIGRWTAEMFLIFSLRRADVFSYGDLGLRKAMQKIYKMKKLPTPAQAARITAKWKPYRSMGARYLWASLRNEPIK